MLKLITTTICLLFGLTAAANAAPVAAVVSVLAAGGIQGAIARIGLSLAISFITNRIFGPEVPKPNSDLQSAPDPGVKARIPTDTANKLPVVYGEAKAFGTVTYADITSDNQKMAFLIPLCEGPVNSIGTLSSGDSVGLFWDNYKLTFDGDIHTGLRSLKAGTTVDFNDEKDDFLEAGRLKIQAFKAGGRCTPMETFSTKWADNAENRTMPNVAYLYVELTYDREKGVTGLTSKLGAVIQGKLIRAVTRGPNTGTVLNPVYAYSLSETLTYSNNPADCLADFLTNTTYGGGGVLSGDTLLDLETFYDHQQYCATMVPHTSGTSTVMAPRFSLNGVANTNDTRDLTISDMCINSQAILSYQLGRFQMRSDKAENITSTPRFVNTTPEDSSPSTTTGGGVFQTYGDVSIVNDGFNSQLNRITGSFVSKLNQYQDDQVYLDLPESLENEFEPEFIQDTRFKFINNNVQAERIGYTILRKSRDTLVISFDTDVSALALQPNDIVRVTNETYGFTNKPFRITTINETEIGEGNLVGYKITAQEYNATAYIDDTENPFTEFAEAPNVNIPKAGNLQPPTGFNFSSTDEGESSVTFNWNTPATGGPVEGFQIAYYVSTTAIDFSSLTQDQTDEVLNARTIINNIEYPTEGGQYAHGSGITHTVLDIPAGAFIYFWVRSTNSFGFRSAYALIAAPVTDFTPTIITDLEVVNIYKQAATTPVDAPALDFVYSFTTNLGLFTGSVNNSNGWFTTAQTNPEWVANTAYVIGNFVTRNGAEYIATSNSNRNIFTPSDWAEVTLFSRGATVTNLDLTVNPAEWNPVLEISGGMGVQGVAGSFYKILYQRSATALTAPTGVTYNGLAFGNLGDWKERISETTGTDNLYSTTAIVDPSDNTITAWDTPIIIEGASGTSFYEVYAYARAVLVDGNLVVPTAPVTNDGVGTGTAKNGILTGRPSTPAGAQTTAGIIWQTSLAAVQAEEGYQAGDRIYRSTAPVADTTIGTWSTSGLFLLRGNDGAAGAASPTNLIRYGVFESDEAAQIARLATDNNNGNGLNTTWVSSPDLLGVNASGEAISYTHTTTQFGTIENPGSFTNQTFVIDGTLTTSAGSPARTELTFEDPSLGVGLTIWEGQTQAATTAVLNTNITAALPYYNVNLNTEGWEANTGLTVAATEADAAFDFNLTTFSIAEFTGYRGTLLNGWNTPVTSLFGTARKFIAITVGGDEYAWVRSSSTDASDFGTLSIEDIIEEFATTNGQTYSSTTGIPGYQNSSGTIRLYRDAADPERMFMGFTNSSGLIDNFDGTDGNITSIRFGLTLSSSSNTPNVDIVSAASHTGYGEQFARGSESIVREYHQGYTIDINRNGSDYLSGPEPWTIGQSLSSYLGDWVTTLTGASITTTSNGRSLNLTFPNNGDTWTIPEWSNISATFDGGGIDPSSSTTVGAISGNTPQEYIIDITPTFKANIDYDSLTAYRYSDVYTANHENNNYPATLTSDNDILAEIQNRLDGLSHVDVTRMGGTLRFTYTQTTQYGLIVGTVAAGDSSGFDGSVPQPFIHFGEDEDGGIITGLTVTTHQVGRGAGRLIDLNGDAYTRPVNNLRLDGPDINLANPYAVFESYNFTSELVQNDTTTQPVSRQIYNAVRVLLPTFYTDVAPTANTQLLLTTSTDVASPEHTVFMEEINGWTTTNVAGALGDPYTITLARVNGTGSEFQDTSYTINIPSTATPTTLTAALAEQDARLGAYIVSIPEGDDGGSTLQVQDAGTGPTLFTLTLGVGAGSTLDPSDSMLTIAPVPATTALLTQGTDVIGTATDYLLPTDTNPVGTVLRPNRWTRPVNTGVQV